MRSRAILFISATLALLGSVACGSGSASPTPIGLVELRVLLTRAGVTTLSAVSGGSACPGQALADNALHLTVTVPSDATPRDLYLYLFRAREFEGTDAAMDACVAEVGAARPGQTISRLDVAPYRALGLDWPADLSRAVESALREAAPGG